MLEVHLWHIEISKGDEGWVFILYGSDFQKVIATGQADTYAGIMFKLDKEMSKEIGNRNHFITKGVTGNQC